MGPREYAKDCFFNKEKFASCKFNENTVFVTTKPSKIHGSLSAPSSGFRDQLKETSISGIYRSIKEGFLAGQVYTKVRKYLFLQHQAYTRYNRTGAFDKAGAYFWELSTGYGLRPARVLVALVSLYLVVFLWFTYRLGSIRDSFIFSAGAFLTFGARTELLTELPMIDHIVYVVAAFAGVALVALFITVMANVHLKDN